MGNRAAPRVFIIGAGSRGNAYARAIVALGKAAVVCGVAEPHAQRRNAFGEQYIWGRDGRTHPRPGEAFAHWEEFVAWETLRRTDGSRSDGEWRCSD